MKFIALAIVAALICRVAFGKWPWQFWVDAEKSQKRAQARVLLGVAPGAGRDEILAAHKRALHTAHPDRGGSSEAVHELDAARDLLLEPIARKKR